tara:strand:- start:414 stop:734 length:321 start_codon:yes stop_codon:yes gene_type:complete
MKRYLYFGEATVETTGEACLFAVDTFLGMTPGSSSSTQLHFNSRNGAATDDTVVVSHTGHTTKAFMTEIVKFLQDNQRNPFLIISDRTNTSAVTGMIASVAVETEA